MFRAMPGRVIGWIGRAFKKQPLKANFGLWEQSVSSASSTWARPLSAAHFSPHFTEPRNGSTEWYHYLSEKAPSVFVDDWMDRRSVLDFKVKVANIQNGRDSVLFSARDHNLGHQVNPTGTSAASVAHDRALDASVQKLCFTGTGRLMLGLGALGIISSLEGGSYESDSSSVYGENATPFKVKLFKHLEEVFKLNHSAASCSASSSPTSAGSFPSTSADLMSCADEPSSPESVADVDTSDESFDDDRVGSEGDDSAEECKADCDQKTVHEEGFSFDRLVVGDRLVLREGDITRDQWRALASFIESCPHIRSIRFQGIEITSREADQLGESLKQIRHITFCNNSIGLHEGTLEVLVAILLCCGLLESTSIIRNSINDDHVESLVSLLKRHRRLTHLSLSWNGIGNVGAKQLANSLDALKSSLRHIDLSYNLIGEEGKAALRRVAKKRLQYFGSSANPIEIFMHHNEHPAEYKENDVVDTDDPDWRSTCRNSAWKLRRNSASHPSHSRGLHKYT